MKYLLFALLPAILTFTGCSSSNNLLLGRVEVQVAGHTIVVTDCYRIRVPAPETFAGGDLHFMPCRDADIWIRSGMLSVNGNSYGSIGPADAILVDHGEVSVQRAQRRHG